MVYPCRSRLTLGAFFVALVSCSAGARADELPRDRECYACAYWLPVGINLGASLRRHAGNQSAAFFLGAELSAIDMRSARDKKGLFFGLYLDTLFDTRARMGRTSLGPEWIYFVQSSDYALGVDLGAAMEWDRGGVNLGGRLRVFFPMVFVTPYVGATRLEIRERFTLLEAGVLLKYPFELAR